MVSDALAMVVRDPANVPQGRQMLRDALDRGARLDLPDVDDEDGYCFLVNWNEFPDDFVAIFGSAGLASTWQQWTTEPDELTPDILKALFTVYRSQLSDDQGTMYSLLRHFTAALPMHDERAQIVASFDPLFALPNQEVVAVLREAMQREMR